jgi:Protein of unknown function (DUF2806)
MSIKDLAGVEKPLTKLVESISNGIGVIYEPTRIRRKAKADADAMLTLTRAEIQAEELRSLAAELPNYINSRRKRNIDQIVSQTVKELPESVDEKPVDEDWIVQFFNQSQDVGDAEMQSLWARLLAGEVAQPGTYSLRTLQTVKVLGKNDAQLFSQYCSYVWLPSGGDLCRYPTRETDKFIADKGIKLGERRHLHNLGLLSMNLPSSSGGAHTAISSRDEPFEVTYFGRKYLIRPLLNPQESALFYPEFLTDVGTQLFPISGAQPDEQYLEILIKALAEDKLEVSPLN